MLEHMVADTLVLDEGDAHRRRSLRAHHPTLLEVQATTGAGTAAATDGPSSYPTPESTADPADPDAASTSDENSEDSVVDEGSAIRRRRLRSASARNKRIVANSNSEPHLSSISRQGSTARASSRIAVAKSHDLDDVAPIVEIEDAEGIDVLVAAGRSVGHERRQQRLLSKKVASRGGKIGRSGAVSKLARSMPGSKALHSHSHHHKKAAAKPRSTSDFAAAAVEIYKPKERTFHVRHYRASGGAPVIKDLEEMTKLMPPLPSPSPSPPPDGDFDATAAGLTQDPRRICTHLRKCFNEATLIEFDKQGFVASPPEAREIFRNEGLRCIRHTVPPARCHTLHAEILSLLPVSLLTSWRGMGAGGASQKFLWLTEQQIVRFGLEYRFDRHRPMPESQHQRFVERVHKMFGKDFEGPVIALQPNFQQADFPLHTDQPALEGFGNKIITVGVYGEGWVVLRDKDGKRSFKFKVGTGDAWAMVGRARWEWAHGVLCETYPSDMEDPEQQPNLDEPQKFTARRVSLNIRIE